MPRPPRSSPQTKHFAIELRHDPTPAERKLWTHLRNEPAQPPNHKGFADDNA